MERFSIEEIPLLIMGVHSNKNTHSGKQVLMLRLHSEKRVAKKQPLGCYLAVHNLAPLRVLFWHPIDRAVLFSHKTKVEQT